MAKPILINLLGIYEHRSLLKLYTILSMMTNSIEILSPGTNCRKTQKIIKSMEQFFIEHNIEADIKIISGLREFVKYKTWIVPTIIINGKVVARGYRPANEKILKNLKQ